MPKKHTILLLGDIHNKWEIAEQIIKKENQCQSIIFIGDAFDSFYDTPEINRRTAIWLKEKLTNPNFIMTMGNHDCFYRWNLMCFGCSGNTTDKYNAINSIMTRDDWNKIKMWHIQGSYLFTHAGLHPFFYKGSPRLSSVSKFLKHQEKDFFINIHKKQSNWFTAAGRSRGGMSPYGGLTWMDWNQDFKPIKGISQVVGHTECKEPEWYEGNLNLDCGLRYYGILNHKQIEIKSFV